MEIRLGSHVACIENIPSEQREINRYWDICCLREPEIQVIKTTFEEFLILNQKLDEISTNLFNFRKTVIDRLNKFELLLEFVKTQEQILPQSLITMPWVIFSVDWKVFLDPFNIEKLCELLDIDIVAEDIYGKDKLEVIKKNFQSQIEKKQLMGFFEELSDYPLLPQQNKLKYRIHYANYETEGLNEMLISEKPIDHITATFLYIYYQNYLSLVERPYEEYYNRIFVHEYRHLINYYLDNEEYVKNQKYLIHKFKIQ